MNRLSTSRDIEFKGKIQSFLSSVLPLTHKSGLNVSGRFNIQKNNTGIEQQIEGASAQEVKLYKNFWSLQKVLAHPHQLFQSNITLDLEDIEDEIQSDFDESMQKRDSAEESGAIPDDFMEPKKDQQIEEERESGQILETSQEISIKKAVAKIQKPSNLL